MNVLNKTLLWWTFVCLSFIFTLTMATIGAVQYIATYDQTYLSFVIFGGYVAATAYLGVCIYKSYQIEWNLMWYVVNVMTSLGLIGTVAGILIMVNNAFLNAELALENLSQIQSGLLQGMGTATTTTLAGLIYSVFLSFQLMTLNRE